MSPGISDSDPGPLPPSDVQDVWSVWGVWGVRVRGCVVSDAVLEMDDISQKVATKLPQRRRKLH